MRNFWVVRCSWIPCSPIYSTELRGILWIPQYFQTLLILFGRVQKSSAEWWTVWTVVFLGRLFLQILYQFFLQIICLWFPRNIMNLIIVVLWIVLIHYGNSPFAIHLGALIKTGSKFQIRTEAWVNRNWMYRCRQEFITHVALNQTHCKSCML